jgi:hypothetical protein
VNSLNVPAEPQTTFPDAHVWADRVIWAVALGLLVYALRDWRRTGSPIGVVLMAGGALAYFNESVDDVLGLVHHPRPGQNVVLDTIGAVPMWGLPTYIIFFGAIAFVFLRELERGGFRPRLYWAGIAITFVVDLALEMPLLWADGGLYQYYGDTPMTIARFPLYWLLINTPGPLLCATILYAAPGYFRGWRAPLVVLVPFVADAACSIVAGLPIYTALHAPAAGDAVRWGAGLLTCAIGLLLLDAFARVIVWRQGALSGRALDDRDLALAAVDTQRVAVADH